VEAAPGAAAVRVQGRHLALAAILAGAVVVAAAAERPALALLFLVGLALGFTLYHASFGFTGAYRRLFLNRDLSGVAAQAAMLAVAGLLFAPALAEGSVFGHGVGGTVAPVSVAMLTGAFVFGVGMQLGGGCASGTLFLAGGGDVRLMATLAAFCAGCWLATLDMPWWRGLPSFGAFSFGQAYGHIAAALVQAGLLALAVAALYRLGWRMERPLWRTPGWRGLLRGPWPLLMGALALALLNWAVLLIAGHPWGVTWGFTLWAAKTAAALGWDPASSAYWAVEWRAGALRQSIFADTTSVMNMGIALGAMAAAALAAAIRPSLRIPLRPLAAAILGGLMMGYGARLAYGCNIGAFFSGVASTSLHGWAWIAMALAGNYLGVRLRPLFGLANG